MQQIIQDIEQLIADIQAKKWLAVARDFAKLISDVTAGAGTVAADDPQVPALKAALYDVHAEAAAAGSHPILDVIIKFLPIILQILTGLGGTTGA